MLIKSSIEIKNEQQKSSIADDGLKCVNFGSKPLHVFTVRLQGLSKTPLFYFKAVIPYPARRSSRGVTVHKVTTDYGYCNLCCTEESAPTDHLLSI